MQATEYPASPLFVIIYFKLTGLALGLKKFFFFATNSPIQQRDKYGEVRDDFVRLVYQSGAVLISLHNIFICFFSKVKKDLTMVQAKYVPNPEKDQLTVLKVTKYGQLQQTS